MTPSVRAMTESSRRLVDVELAAVEREQPPARVRVGQLQHHRLVDPAGSGGERRLEHLGAVGGEQEHHVGVLGEPVHLVEQLEQQRVGAGYIPRSSAIRSTSSTTIIAGWRVRATEQAVPIRLSASPVSSTIVTSVSWPTR